MPTHNGRAKPMVSHVSGVLTGVPTSDRGELGAGLGSMDEHASPPVVTSWRSRTLAGPPGHISVPSSLSRTDHRADDQVMITPTIQRMPKTNTPTSKRGDPHHDRRNRTREEISGVQGDHEDERIFGAHDERKAQRHGS